MSRILVVDDEPSLRQFLKLLLEKEGHAVTCGASLEEAESALEACEHDLVLTDLRMGSPDSGLQVLRAAARRNPAAQVVVMTAHGTIESAKEAIRLGAFDYIQKPFDNNDLRALVRRALDRNASAAERLRAIREEVHGTSSFEGIVGRSDAMLLVFDLIDRVAPTGANVMILGESGTGKELVAQAIHRRSDRAQAPFVPVNCAAIPESLMESEMFGHVRGAFTGAHQSKRGLFEEANRGTLFLDEVGELPLAMQGKLLRALQERTVRRVGGNEDLAVDVRIVCASKRNLEEEMQAGRFRDDLFYRLGVFPFVMPPLRERREDIPALANLFLARCSERMGKSLSGFRPDAMEALASYDYPGNVRELENLVERAAIIESSSRITPASLPGNVTKGAAPFPESLEWLPKNVTSTGGGEEDVSKIGTPAQVPSAEVSNIVTSEGGEGGDEEARFAPLEACLKEISCGERVSIDTILERAERVLIRVALEKTKGNRTEAAKTLGINLRSLRYRLEKLGVE
jgi:DNA-binding NtrC family response regulator